MEIESSGKRLILDIGLPLDAEDNDKKYLPSICGLAGGDESLLAILISHSHLDHFGLLEHVNKSIPVYMGAAARHIIEAASPFLPGNWTVPSIGGDFRNETPVELGPFTITPFLVDHAAYDAYALMVDADGKRLFYSGDFRMHGRKSKLLERLMSNPPAHIDAMLMEGSSLGRLEHDDNFPGESDVEQSLVNTFKESTGLVMVHASSQNIDRIVSIFRACKKTGRRLIVDLYTAIVLEATGNLKLPQSDWPEISLYVPNSQRIKIKKLEYFEPLKRHSKNRIFIEDLRGIANKSVLLFRPLHINDLEKADCIKGAVYIYSQWEGYWEKESYAYLREWLIKRGIPKISIHTSGHASPQDLKRFVTALNPRKVIPIHTFHPDQFKELFPNVVLLNDGQTLEV